MKLIDMELAEHKPVEAWLSCGNAEFLLIVPVWFPRRDEWLDDFGRCRQNGSRQLVLCLRAVNRADHWLPAISVYWCWRVVRVESSEPTFPDAPSPRISIEQAKSFNYMGDDELASVVNAWDKRPPTVEMWAGGKAFHVPADEAEKAWLSVWSNPPSCKKFIEELGCGLRTVSKRFGDGSIVYEVFCKHERSYVWRTDEFDKKAFLPGIRFALAVRCVGDSSYEEVKGKKFISVRCSNCGEVEDWVYNVPSYGFVSFVCSRCKQKNTCDTKAEAQ